MSKKSLDFPDMDYNYHDENIDEMFRVHIQTDYISKDFDVQLKGFDVFLNKTQEEDFKVYVNYRQTDKQKGVEWRIMPLPGASGIEDIPILVKRVGVEIEYIISRGQVLEPGLFIFDTDEYQWDIISKLAFTPTGRIVVSYIIVDFIEKRVLVC